MALKQTAIDPASFTTIRFLAGASTLSFILILRRGKPRGGGNWVSAFSLFVYGAGFSFAYKNLPASSGALILFSSVQATMIFFGLWNGERFRWRQIGGLLMAFFGVVVLFLPKLTAPPAFGSLLMCIAGLAWGVYSIRGKGAGDPLSITTGNFLRAAPLALGLGLLTYRSVAFDRWGVIYAVASGAVASGVGYAIWYAALPHLKATTAAVVQLAVPVLTALGGILFLKEHLSIHLALATVAILGGIAIFIFDKRKRFDATPAGNTKPIRH